ncbi:VIR protein [Plasmodium vivax]|uniref:VIR protein n=1 Tax=Plasmodium vivax TaxID=5855 RepID=A0A1G4E5T1_PLAVI|nr:VIR protein [Plasmodium vivax]
MAERLTKKDLDKFPSNIWYSNFEGGDKGCEQVSFYSEIKGELEGRHQYYDLSKISDNIVRALCYLYKRKMYHQKDFDKDRFSYLYYWLGDKIYSRVHDKKIFSIIIKMIYEVFYSTDFRNTCNPLFKDIDIDKDTFNTYKMLHDYSKDYGNIKTDTSHGYTTCDKNYKEFVEKYINTYNDVYSNCKTEKTKKYHCDYFDKLFEGYNHNDLSSFHCMKHNVQTLSDDEREEHGPSRPPLLLSETSSGTPVFLIYPKPQGYDGQNLGHNPHKPHDLGGRQELGSDVSIPTDETAKSGSSKTIAGSIAPVLGVSSISLLLYKVTPVGGYINRLLGRNRNMYNHIEYMDTFNPYSDGMNPEGRRMNISYHRL